MLLLHSKMLIDLSIYLRMELDKIVGEKHTQVFENFKEKCVWGGQNK